jgi:hypothetical protein
VKAASGHPYWTRYPEALLPLLVFKDSLGLDPKTIVGTTFAFTILDLIVTKLRLPLLQDRSAQ